jgi:hypothetical protein
MSRGTIKHLMNVVPGGIREDLNPAAIPDGEYLASNNWITRNSVGRPRPGYTQAASALDAGDAIMGIGFRGSRLASDNIVLHTLTAGYHWNGSSITDITGSWTTSDVDEHVRMVTFESSGTTYLVRGNQTNSLTAWDGTGSFASISADANAMDPIDLVVASRRVVALNPSGFPFRVAWSDFQDHTTWGANDFTEIDDTQGEIIGGAALSPLSFAILKNDSVYLATAQASRTPFQFQMIARMPGPVSPAAIVPLQGAVYWLAEDLNVYAFDGARIQGPLGKGLAQTLQDNYSFSARRQSHGFAFAVKSAELWFVYPVVGNPDIMNSFSLNIASGAVNKHMFADSITASTGWKQSPGRTIDDLASLSSTIDGLTAVANTIDGLGVPGSLVALLGQSNGEFHRFGVAFSDDGTEIAWDFTHGWRPAAGIDNRIYLDAMVSYWKLTPGSATVSLDVTVSDEINDNEAGITKTFDLSASSNHLVDLSDANGLHPIGKWVKVKHSGSSYVNSMEHRGSAILGWPRAMV